MMKETHAIEVRNVTKSFRVYRDKGHSLKDRVLFRERNKYELRTVLDDISFSVDKGEAVGLIGHNGCGKSTTLKLLTKIIYPDKGEIETQGRVSSLLELGAGFHPDLSGRDNIFINASIFGLNRKEIEEKLDEIIDFSELRDFIDNPVRTYSSGMYMRLAFSVAIHVNADILLIDEILAVGDTNFQAKCFQKLKEVKANGTTIIIVSHSLQQIESICDRTIWINEGKIKEDGYTYAVHIKYLNYMTGFRLIDSDDSFAPSEDNKDQVTIESVALRGEQGEKSEFEINESIHVDIHYKSIETQNGDIVVSLNRRDGVICFAVSYEEDNKTKYTFEKEGILSITFNNVQLIENEYHFVITVLDQERKEINRFQGAAFSVVTPMEEKGVAFIQHHWKG